MGSPSQIRGDLAREIFRGALEIFASAPYPTVGLPIG
jgi:hypothetical protein